MIFLALAVAVSAQEKPPAPVDFEREIRPLLSDFCYTCHGPDGAKRKSKFRLDHHPRCFTRWLAGGGVKPGLTYGQTDDHRYKIVEDPVEVHDLNATILHCLGMEHTRLTFKDQGRHHRLTDVHGKLVPGILA